MRQHVITKVPADTVAEANNYLVGLFGDDPGSDEIALNAYVDGENENVATHSFGCANCSQADATSIANYMASTMGCASAAYPVSGPIPSWPQALSVWGLKPAVNVP